MTSPDPKVAEIAGLSIERRGCFERLRRCDDTFGKMLLVGKIKGIDQRLEELRSALLSDTPNPEKGE